MLWTLDPKPVELEIHQCLRLVDVERSGYVCLLHAALVVPVALSCRSFA